MYKEKIGSVPLELGRNRRTERPSEEINDIEDVKLVITSRMTKLEGKTRLSEHLFPALAKLDFSSVDSRIATEMIRKACKEIEIVDETDQVIEQYPSASNLLRKIPTPHMFLTLGGGQKILVVPKDVDLLFIYHPTIGEGKRLKNAWVCGGIITV